MRLIDYLNELEAKKRGILHQLYKLGHLSGNTMHQRNLYLDYQARLSSSDHGRLYCIRATAKACGVAQRTVNRAIMAMLTPIV